MNPNGLDTTETLPHRGQKQESEKSGNGSNGEVKSMPLIERDISETERVKPRNRIPAAYAAAPIRVSEEQFRTMREETYLSFHLLNSSASALLRAMESIPPSPDSGRVMGEYSSAGMRQLAKSVCDIIRTKCEVVRQIHSIVRDE